MNSSSGPSLRKAETEIPSIVSLNNVTKEYRSEGLPVRAVDGVSLEIAPGAFVALVGRSGCGKSTLLNLAGAMDFPTSGEVRLDGVATSSLADAGLTRMRREKVGFIFQSFQLLPTLSVVENVELPLLLAGKSNARDAANERLGWVELESLGNRMPHQLSGRRAYRESGQYDGRCDSGAAAADRHGTKHGAADGHS
jgi:putative ABC transport system ATP-binding protein